MSKVSTMGSSGRLRRLGAALGCMWLVAACNVVAGLDHDFEQVIPANWQGPFEVIESAVVPNDCPVDFEEVSLLHAELSSAGCQCTVPATACRPTFKILPKAAVNCNELPMTQFPLAHDECTQVDLVDQYARIGEIAATNQACVGEPAPPAWGVHTRVCRGSASATCILKDGDLPCPDGPFTERRLRYGDHLDDRSCDCGSLNEPCAGTVQLFVGTNNSTPCQGIQVGAHQALGQCLGIVSANYVKFDGTPPTELSCSSDGIDATSGDVVPVNPVTICCASEPG